VLLWLGDFAPAPEPEGWPVRHAATRRWGFRVDDPLSAPLPSGENFAAYDPTAGSSSRRGQRRERAAQATWAGQTRRRVSVAGFPRASRLAVTPEENA